MHPRHRISRSRSTTLGLALIAGTLLPASTALADPPPTITLTGVIRDFKNDNTNLVALPSGGSGHYVGNLSTTLGNDERPVFVGGGHRVNSEWRNQAGKPIPPTLCTIPVNAGGIVSVLNMPSLSNNPTVDSFNSSLGPYGGSNIGPAPTFMPNSPMPVVSEPTGLPALVPSASYSGNSTYTLSTDLHCNTFLLSNNAVLQINGNRVILCETSFQIKNHATLEMLANSSLTVYIKGSCTFSNNIDANPVNANVNTYTPTKFKIINLGSTEIVLDNHVMVYAQVTSPLANLNLGNNCDFCGNFTGKSIILSNSAGYHNDGYAVVIPKMCGVALNDAPGSYGLASDGGITSASGFSTWFTDVLGTNFSTMYSITLTRNANGVYEYLNNDFHPIDNVLFGNQNDSHNNYFTYHIAGTFVHHACDGRFFEFSGDDDAWLFVNGRLAMDLGGVLPGTSQYVEIDRVNQLQDGQVYTFAFFFAQRQNSSAHFNMRTNLDIISSTPSGQLSITGAFD